ncbi:MAG: glycoside hydrolase family 3 N-terminal domain-containing protein [Kiritimatiellales bacterium]
MTLSEKVGQLNQHMFGWKAYCRCGSSYELTQAFRDEVTHFDGMGALYGLFRADPWSEVTWENGILPEHCARVANQIQHYVLEHTRLKIPILLSEEVPHGHQALGGTLSPVNLGSASSWNPELYGRMMNLIGEEVRRRGGHLGLVSCLDILRDPRWGRSEECFGEDPYLASRFAAAATRGLQSAGMAAVLKHFCAQGDCEGGRNLNPATIGPRELREIHLPAMRAGVNAGALGCMAAYNEIDGIPCHANRDLLTGILRDEWGYEGFVMADGKALDRLRLLAGDDESAGAMALKAGVDLSLWDAPFYKLENAVEQGKVKEEEIDLAVRRILRVKFELGLFEHPYVDENVPVEIQSNEIRETNLQLARESLVLLKNENQLLPLNGAKRIAVIGPNADSLYNQLGDYTAPQRSGDGITVLQGIRAEAGSDVTVDYVRGCGVRDSSQEEFDAAVQAAKNADVVIAVMGGCSSRDFSVCGDETGAAKAGSSSTEMDCGEGMDVADLEPGGVQTELVEALAETGVPVVLVLIQGRPYAAGRMIGRASAVLCAWYPGQQGGKAVAEVLFGKFNPCGKLPVTFPRSSSVLPVYYNRKNIGREIRYCNESSPELFPFGFGLSFTTFEYSKLQLSSAVIRPEALVRGERVVVSVDVQNIGRCGGHEVVQLYIRDVESSVVRRVKELKGFKKVWLEPGEMQTVSIEIGREGLSVWDASMTFTVEPGLIEIMCGSSSADVLKTELLITD